MNARKAFRAVLGTLIITITLGNISRVFNMCQTLGLYLIVYCRILILTITQRCRHSL